jgi:hypothetical protein
MTLTIIGGHTMRFRKYIWPTVMAVLVMILNACNMGAAPAPTQDTSAIQTQAMELVLTQSAMQQTQTAMAVPPSPLPSPTFSLPPTATQGGVPQLTPVGTPGAGTPFAFNTQPSGFTPLASPVPTSGETCHRLDFIEDVTIPDGTVLKPGQDFQKIWRVINSGTCAWDDGYVLVYQGGKLDGYNVKIEKTKDFVQPGQVKDFGVDLTASLTEDHYEECWRMRDDGGFYFGSYLCVVIDVKK